MTKLFLESVLLPDGWHEDVLLGLDGSGIIQTVQIGASSDAADEVFRGAVIPGMPNLHSHAFQRAMVGLSEHSGETADSFWTWRKIMYGFLQSISPEDTEAIAAQLYVEMLKAGYTSVAEFHYLHHDVKGAVYSNLSEMSHRIIAAAQEAGIGLTHLPVLYAHSGFGSLAPNEGQARFVSTMDQYGQLLSGLTAQYKDVNGLRFGIAPHSLRAVSPELLVEAIAIVDGFDSAAPIHIHVAEQLKEVKDSVAWSGKRPVEWLLDQGLVNERWCLIHSTHLTSAEVQGMAQSGAVAGLCPTTEGNLGDGIFQSPEYVAAGGALGIGTDSHISLDVTEELRLLEYNQRLKSHERNVMADAPNTSTGRSLYNRALAGGAQALGRKTGRIAIGYQADLLVLDTNHPSLYGRSGDEVLDSWIFFNSGNPVKDVYVSGRKVVSEGHHAQEDRIASDFRKAIDRLKS